MNTETIKNLDHQYIMQTYNRYPLAIVKGQGVKVWDAEGKEYLDFLSGIAVNPLGHCHPSVVEAITQQAQSLLHISNLYYTKPAIELAQLLVENGGLDKVFFCNSGAEANEAAIKLARKYQWRKGLKQKMNIITAAHSFHGRTYGALAATCKPEIQEGFGALPAGFSYVEWNDIDALRKSINLDTAAVMLEPVQGEAGIYPAEKSFLQSARELCDEYGAVLIFDEIQCGMGRLGTLFAYQTYDVQPDVITLAKGIASGLPLGAVCAKKSVANAFQFGDHATTFGANPVASSSAFATVKTLLEKNCLKRVIEMGGYLKNKLEQLQKKYPEVVGEVRGKGLMIGVELKTDANSILNACHKNGLLLNVAAKKVLRFLPPYIISKTDIDKAINILEESL